jgi:hypothetical protein
MVCYRDTFTFYFFIFFKLEETESLRMLVANGPFRQPRLACERNGAFSGIEIDCGNRVTRRKPVSIPFGPPQIPRYLTWDWTRAAAVRIWRLQRELWKGLIPSYAKINLITIATLKIDSTPKYWWLYTNLRTVTSHRIVNLIFFCKLEHFYLAKC